MYAMPAMGRPRAPGNEDLPDNLYPNRDGFKYVRPTDGKPFYWKVSREAAVRSAKKLNDLLAPAPGDLVKQVMGATSTVAEAISVFRREDIPHRKWTAKTAAEHAIRLARIEADLGKREVGPFTVRDAADYLKRVTSSLTARQKYRHLLILIFDCAVEEGWCETNPFAITRKVIGIARERARLTPEGYEAVYKAAGDLGMVVLQRAMRLGRKTLLRRADLCGFKFADYVDGWIHVVPKKTSDSTRVRLKLRADAEVDAIIAECRDNVVSPNVLHQLPRKARPRHMRAEARQHHTEILPEQLTRMFAEARDHSGFYAGVENPPSLHELRSLGADDYRQKGWPEERIQALMGHGDVDMTRVYLEGHEPPWTEISLT